jgi:hypothetical protein
MIESSVKYTFRNQNLNSIIVIIEPWAEEFTVPPDSVLSIIIFHTKLGLLETAISPNYFTVGLWAGCRAEVSLDGNDMTPRSLSIPAFG